MERPRGSRQDSLSPDGCSEKPCQGTEQRCAEQLDGATLRCVGSTAGFPLQCTASERTACQITDHLPALNKILWNARLELRKLPGTPGQLSLFSFDEPCLPRPKKNQMRTVADLACHVLKSHPCLASINICTSSFKESETLFRDALKDNTSIKSFTVNFSGFVKHNDFYSTISSLANLQQLECGTAAQCPAAFCAALTEVLKRATSLRALRLPQLCMKYTDANAFLAALTANTTLEELSLHGSVIGNSSLENRITFSKYVGTSTTLTKLSVGGQDVLRLNSLKWILRGLLENRTVTDASLTDFLLDSESARLMTKILAGNDVLRKLNISVRSFDTWTEPHWNFASRAECRPWLHALAVNGTLEAVTLPLTIFELVSWQLLFRTLAAKNSVMKLTITGQCSQHFLWKKLWKTLTGSVAENNVVFDSCIYELQNSEILSCRGFSQIYVYPYGETWDVLHRTLLLLPSLSHITSVHLIIWFPDVDEMLSAAISRYLATTTTLRELHLSVWLRHAFGQLTEERWQFICAGLSQNASIKELHIGASSIDDDAVELLADTIKSCSVVRAVHLTTGEPRIASNFIRRLRVRIEDNYNLVNVRISGGMLREVHLSNELFVIHDTARRNADIVAWAADFVSGATHDRLSACALERVARHPALLDELAEQLSVSGCEAAEMVSRGQRSIESMDDFMRLTGVVRKRVECHAMEDGRPQLDTLNEYCWRAVRRHIHLEDVWE